MKSFKYIGMRQELRGKTALLRPARTAGRVLAQFDDVSLVLPGELIEDDPHARPFPNVKPIYTEDKHLVFGWREFPATDFEDH